MRTLTFLTVPLVGAMLALGLEACGGSDSVASGAETSVDAGSGGSGVGGSESTGAAGDMSHTGSGGSVGMAGSSTGVGGSSMGAGGSTGGGGSASAGCPNPTPYLVSNGVATVTGDTGYEKCGNGLTHRRAPTMCPLGPSADVSPCLPRDGQCTSDAECTRFPHGICANVHKLLGYCGCFYGCFKDDDCPAGNICYCGTPAGACVPATCTGDASCPAGRSCLSASTSCAGGTMGAFACDKPEDECIADVDCAGKMHCVLQADRRRCVPACILTPGGMQ